MKIFQKVAIITMLLVAVGGIHGWTAALDSDHMAGKEILEQINMAVADSVDKVLPAVVNIRGEKKVEMTNPFEGTPFERLIPQRDREQKAYSLGSGFIVDGKNGYILTNNHVIADADKIIVQYFGPDGQAEFEGEAFPDPKTELALVKIIDLKGMVLPEAKLGDSDALRVGHMVMAIGSPFSKSQSVSKGIVSGLGRNEAGFKDIMYKDFIQTDAAINRGNSGGPLLNIYGEVIGINTYIYSTSGGAQGVGFAIPSNLAKMVIDPLISEGRVTRPFLGVFMESVGNWERDKLKEFGLEEYDKGVIVVNLEQGSPAYEAGVQKYDVLLEMDGKPINDASGLQQMVLQKDVGQKVDIKLWRPSKQKEITVTATLVELPEGGFSAMSLAKGKTSKLLGMQLRPSTEKEAADYGLEEAKGLMVVGVDEESSAAEEGISKGDIILEANWIDLAKIDDLSEVIEKRKKENKDTIMLRVLKKDGEVLPMIDLE